MARPTSTTYKKTTITPIAFHYRGISKAGSFKSVTRPLQMVMTMRRSAVRTPRMTGLEVSQWQVWKCLVVVVWKCLVVFVVVVVVVWKCLVVFVVVVVLIFFSPYLKPQVPILILVLQCISETFQHFFLVYIIFYLNCITHTSHRQFKCRITEGFEIAPRVFLKTFQSLHCMQIHIINNFLLHHL